MLVSGVIAIASLVGILVACFAAAVVLTLVDKKFDGERQH